LHPLSSLLRVEREGVVFWGVAIDRRNFIVDLSQHLHSEFQWDNKAVSDR
jgi:hypothetical protein